MIKSLLVDPTVVPDKMSLKSSTRNSLSESFLVRDNPIVPNINDTVGLLEYGNNEIHIHDNETILQMIELGINYKIKQFVHFRSNQ